MGDASATLLIPSLGGSARLFESQWTELWSLGPVMVAEHLRAATIASMAARILDRAPRRFDLAGVSMGGYLAFEILRQAPERVGRLALLDTSANVDTDDARADRIRQCEMARDGRFDEIVDLQFPNVVHPAHVDDPARRETFRRMLRETGPEAFVRQQTACLERDESVSMLPTIRCPTLVVVGDADEITPIAHARLMADAIVGARLEVVRECGHLSTIDQPEKLTRLLVAWKRLAART